MSGSDGAQKGWWHRNTNVPFSQTLFPGRDAYLKQKALVQNKYDASGQELGHQLQLKKDLDEQMEYNYLLMEQSIGYARAIEKERAQLLSQQAKLEMDMAARKKNYTTRSVGNSIDFVIGRIPYVGPIYSYGSLAWDGYRHMQDRSAQAVLIEQIHGTETDATTTLATRDKSQSEYEETYKKSQANFNNLKNLQASMEQMKQELDKM